MSWDGDILVTASNPAPGRILPSDNPYANGTTPEASRSDGGLGLNVYIAGGTAASGAIPVAIVSGGSGGAATQVTSTLADSSGNFVGTPTNPLTVVVSGAVSVASGSSLTSSPTSQTDVFGQLVTAVRIPQVQAQFFAQSPSSQVILSASGGATASGPISGVAVFQTTAATSSRIMGTSPASVVYTAHYEVYAAWTWQYTIPTSVNSYQRIGLYNSTDGFSVGYSGTTFGLWSRFSNVDSFIPSSSWNGDRLNGASGSSFTSGSVPVALDPSKLNIYRVRMGWLGAASIFFDIHSPDGAWVTAHTIRFPNSLSGRASVTNPNLPVRFDVYKSGADATNLVGYCGCFVAGVTTFTDQTSLDWNNTTNVPLSGGATFTGIASDALGYSSVLLSVYSDKSSAVNGVAIQFSTDGQNWDETINNSFISGSNAFTIVSPARSRFVRAVYQNGPIAQGVFRMQLILKTTPSFGDILELSDVPTLNDHAQLVKAQLVGKIVTGPSSGTFTDVRVTAGGNLATSNTAVVTPGTAVSDVDVVGFYQGGVAVVASGTTGSMNVAVPGGVQAFQGGVWNVSITGALTSTLTGTSQVSISGVNVVGGAIPVTGTVAVTGLQVSGSFSIPREAYPGALENVQSTRYKQRYDLQSDSVNYVGYAATGTADGDSAWTIKKLAYDASGNLESITWSSTSSIWTNRAGETYQ